MPHSSTPQPSPSCITRRRSASAPAATGTAASYLYRRGGWRRVRALGPRADRQMVRRGRRRWSGDAGVGDRQLPVRAIPVTDHDRSRPSAGPS